MKKLLFFLVLIYGLQASAQNYDISFAGTGASTTVGSVKVDNLTASTTLTLTGSDILRLTVVTDVNPIRNNRLSALKIYPNPMTEYSIMEITPPVEGEAVISVCDMTGKPVAQIRSYLGNLRQDFRFSGLKEGFYLVNVTGKGYQFSGKLVSNVKSNGKISIQKINSIIQAVEEKTTRTESKGTQATLNMAYSIGDRLKFAGSSGNFTTIVMDVPSASKTITFGFVDCTDRDINHYPVVNIGTQVWMAENLKTTRLNDNTPISNVTSNTIWTALSIPAYCCYNNDVTTYKPLYGAMYNWFTLSNVCPTGWRVPTDEDFNTLEVSLGLPLANIDIYGFRGTDQGAKLKNTSGWAAGQNGTNASGFSALPGGYRYGADGSFNAVGLLSYWWSTSPDPNDATAAWYRRLDGTSSQVYKGITAKVAGKYVRCVQN